MKEDTARSILKGLLSVLLLSGLAGCQVDIGSLTGNGGSATTDTTATEVSIAGSVGDGPVTGAQVTAYGSDGMLLGSVLTDSTAGFRSTLKIRGNQYPVQLVVSGGIDLVTGAEPDFPMVSVLMRPSDKVVNINPFTSLVVEVAQRMPGGLTATNVASAQDIVRNRLGFGLDAGQVADLITTTIDSGNVAALVKSCEALGELVRRVRDLSGAGADAVVSALAADLVDGRLDGIGAAGTNGRLSAVATVVSSQVLVESLSDNLRVGGVPAAGIMDQAIQSTMPGISAGLLTGSVPVNAQVLAQAGRAVAAASTLDDSGPVQTIETTLAGLVPGSSATQVANVLPATSTDNLQQAVNLVIAASDSQIQQVNAVDDSAAANSPPQISGSPATSVVAGNSYSFSPQGSDADGDVLTFSVTNKPAWAAFSTTSGRLSGTPATNDVGVYSAVTISVTDGTSSVSLAPFDITVQAAPVANTAPQISGVPSAAVMATTSYSFAPSATDAEGDSLTFSISNKPAWASFSSSTGALSGVPPGTAVGTYSNIVISVSDGQLSSSLPAFSIDVTPVPVVNQPPQISGIPALNVTEGSFYQFQPVASDPDGDALTFSISHKPAWASFSSATGRLRGTPAAGTAGSYANIVISVSDGQASASLPAFTIQVDPMPNQPPVISGTPASSVTATTPYQFQPTASDPDGDTLTFSISHKPAWASFSTATGALSGTPLNADAGSYSNIVISVSDGQASTSLPAFSIQVQAGNGSFTLDWTAPVSRTDGTPLSLADIGGYRVYYGQSSGNYTSTVDVTDGSATSAMISNITAGTWYVAMTTVDSSGQESALSGETTRTAQ